MEAGLDPMNSILHLLVYSFYSIFGIETSCVLTISITILWSTGLFIILNLLIVKKFFLNQFNTYICMIFQLICSYINYTAIILSLK